MCKHMKKKYLARCNKLFLYKGERWFYSVRNIEHLLPGMKYLTSFFLTGIAILFLAFFAVKPVLAMEFRSSDNAVVVAEDEMVGGSLFAGGSSVQINGAVEGDLFCAGQTIIIKGSVGGDVLCAGQTVRIEGTVGGNIRTVGQTVDIDGMVSRNVMIVGQTVRVGKESVVEGEGVFGGQTVSILGDVGKSVLGGGNLVVVEGTVGEDATLAGNTVQIGAGAHIAGKLTYESDKDAVIADGAVVGEIVKQPMRKELSGMKRPEKQFPKIMGFTKGKPWPQNAVGPILIYLVIGALGILLFKNGISKVIDGMKEHAGASFGIGLLWLIVFPVLFILLLITIIGIPIAILYAGLFALIAIVSKLFAAVYVGKEILTSLVKNQKENWYGAVLVGVTVSWLVFSMPIIGGLTSFLAMLWGTGGLVRTVLVRKKK
jgi:hypothetical protein